MKSTRRVDPEDALSINYMPGHPGGCKLSYREELEARIAEAEAHLAAGRKMVDGADQEWALRVLKGQLAEES